MAELKMHLMERKRLKNTFWSRKIGEYTNYFTQIGIFSTDSARFSLK